MNKVLYLYAMVSLLLTLSTISARTLSGLPEGMASDFCKAEMSAYHNAQRYVHEKDMTGMPVQDGSSYSDLSVSIVPDDVCFDGIAYAYENYSFHLSLENVDFTNCEWQLSLPLADGTPSIACQSVGRTFTTPQLTDFEQYAQTADEQVWGEILFEGVAGGKTISASYPISFQQKPHIISVEVISTNVNADNPYCFDALVGIRYEGSQYVHAYVEEEGNPYLTSYYSSAKDYTEMNLTNITSRSRAWLDITVRNEYGSDHAVLELSGGSSTSCVPTEMTVGRDGDGSVSRMDVYDMQGRYIGPYYSCIRQLQGGMYLLRSYDENGICCKVLKIKVY
ncbi:MAG: hypothetical protein K2H16_07320 [Prevotella sp.]|nr:hypothetical protein [Prevotella sp.]